MSIEDITELGELFEYDEFDSYDEHAYQTIITNNISNEGGVPLSVELSESLSKSQTPESEQTSDGFIKAPEIFLRIDASAIDGTSTSKSSSDVSGINASLETNKSKRRVESNSLDSTERSDGLLAPINLDECAELQYENEFGPSDENDCEYVQSTYKQPNTIDDDYEELLFEGINFEHFCGLYDFMQIFQLIILAMNIGGPSCMRL